MQRFPSVAYTWTMETNLKLSALIQQLQTILTEKGDIAIGVECKSEERTMQDGDISVRSGYDDEDSGEFVEEDIVMITTWSLERDRAVHTECTAYATNLGRLIVRRNTAPSRVLSCPSYD